MDDHLVHQISDHITLPATDRGRELFGLLEDHAQTITVERYAGLSQQSQRIIERPSNTGDHCRFDFPCRDTQTISGVPVCIMLE
jgi:hypothetical protein